MSTSIKSRKIAFSALFFMLILASCEYFPSQAPTSTNVSTSVPSLTVSSPEPHYQLTYLVTCETDVQCMYAVEVACLESENPCLGQPQLLFKIAKTGEGPRLPVLASSWSPDGQLIAIEAVGVSGQGDIYVGDWAGQTWTNLTNSPNYEGDPNWSPDGRTIAYVGNTGEPENYHRAYSITPDGKSVSRLLQSLDPIFPDTAGISWSPDGTRITFMHSDNQGYYQLYVSNPDGSNLKQLTNREEDHFDPRFSPDGQWIIYRRQPRTVEMVGDLYLIRPDGVEENAVIQDNSSWEGNQSWAPTGDWVAYELKTQEQSGDYQIRSSIYLVRSDGKGAKQITQGDVDAFAPAWRTYFP